MEIVPSMSDSDFEFAIEDDSKDHASDANNARDSCGKFAVGNGNASDEEKDSLMNMDTLLAHRVILAYRCTYLKNLIDCEEKKLRDNADTCCSLDSEEAVRREKPTLFLFYLFLSLFYLFF